MGNDLKLEGVVVISEIGRPVHPNLQTTRASVMLDIGQKIPYAGFDGQGPHEVCIRGSHTLGGRRVRIEYEHCTGTLWAQSYEILDDKGNAVHIDRSMADD